MIKIEKTEVFNFEGAIRGMRNPLESWAKSDSTIKDGQFIVGEKDLDLMMRLRNAGQDHGKYLRQIFVNTDITAPLYWWKEFDTYKIGTTANSTSTMHKLATTPISRDNFSFDETKDIAINHMIDNLIANCEKIRQKFITTQNPEYWRTLVQILPNAWNQKRTVSLNYAVLNNMYHARKNHKLSEWHSFCSWVETLPFAKELITSSKKQNEMVK